MPARDGSEPMRDRRNRKSTPIESLRLAVECMPVATREAMLAGLDRYERILMGAYVDELGGVCPMLAAHRCGGRTDFLAFARSWDRFARARGGKRAATERERRILVTLLENSLESSGGLELDRAIEEHRSLVAASRRERARRSQQAHPADPRGEIRARSLRGARVRRPARGVQAPGAEGRERPDRRALAPV